MGLGILSDHGFFTLCLVGVHDVLHVENDILSQPVIDDQVLLNIGLCAGGLDQVQDLVTGADDGIAVQLDTELVSHHEGLNHAGDLVIGHFTAPNLLDGVTTQNQDLAQNAQAVFVVVIGQEEGSLDTQNVGVLGPVLHILLIQGQNGRNLLLGQGNGLAVLIEDLDILQFCLQGDDGRIFFIDFHALGAHQQGHIQGGGQINGVLFFSGIGLCGLLDGLLMVVGNCQSSHGNHAQNHYEDQQHAEETFCCLLH